MADLLPVNIRSQIYGAGGVFDDLQDTFFKTPVIYHKAGLGYSDDMEDIDSGNKDYLDYTLNSCLFDESEQKESNKVDVSGALDIATVKVSVFTRKLIEDSGGALWDSLNECPLMTKTEDYFTVAGRKYRVLDIFVEGKFERRGVLVVIVGERLPVDSGGGVGYGA